MSGTEFFVLVMFLIILLVVKGFFDEQDKFNKKVDENIKKGLTKEQAVQQVRLEIKREIEKKSRLDREIREKRLNSLESWKGLDGKGFEDAVAQVFKYRGYRVEKTKASNDKGVDLYLYKNNLAGIVQCKRYSSKIGVNHVRELSGSYHAANRDGNVKEAFLVGLYGFTKNAHEEAKRRNIKLYSIAYDFLKDKTIRESAGPTSETIKPKPSNTTTSKRPEFTTSEAAKPKPSVKQSDNVYVEVGDTVYYYKSSIDDSSQGSKCHYYIADNNADLARALLHHKKGETAYFYGTVETQKLFIYEIVKKYNAKHVGRE